ncbi:hypothetical protein KUTeg_009061 [Tegillarca granosa]|uniref:Uncharacterized protein n=1 Tax=Tegillarca granosa TaxID=220873 RepID=A0ABQ9F7M7_TEGGR|nr:hypothetical protein KUTeg_009061 [Tegillarca granosa]
MVNPVWYLNILEISVLQLVLQIQYYHTEKVSGVSQELISNSALSSLTMAIMFCGVDLISLDNFLTTYNNNKIISQKRQKFSQESNNNI